MRAAARSLLVALLVVAGLATALPAAAVLPLQPFRAVAAMLGLLVHLAAAFSVGSAIMRLVRARTKEILQRLVLATTVGLGCLSLGTLAIAGLGLVHGAVPWAVDLVALLLGARLLREAARELRDAWLTLDLSFVMASRIPLLALLAVVALVHLVPPITPPSRETGAAQLAVASQARVRSDLRAALAAEPEGRAGPALGLLLHGELAGGHDGARMLSLACVLLLGMGVFSHARRHLGGPAAGWATFCLASSPALLQVGARDLSGAFVALTSFLSFAMAADWCVRSRPGKIPLASILGGLAVAEATCGATLLAAVLLFVFVVEVFVDRNGLLRQLPGIAGMILIAAATAAVPWWTAAWLHGVPPAQHVTERFTEPGPPPQVEWTLAPWVEGSPGAGASPAAWAREVALAFGPLLLGLALLVPTVPERPEGLRHAILFLLLSLVAWSLPPPFGTGIGSLAPLAVCAGAAARGLLAGGGLPARLAGLLIAACGPLTLGLSLLRGPNVPEGAAVAIGATSRTDYLERHLPDRPLIARVEVTVDADDGLVLLDGALTDCLYPVPALRWPALRDMDDPDAIARALAGAGVTHVATRAEPGQRDRFAALEPAAWSGRGGRLRLLLVPADLALAEPAEGEALPEGDAPAGD